MNTPATLHKQKTRGKFDEAVNSFIIAHAGILLFICITALLILFVALCYVLIQPMESGLYYNHLMGGNL